MVYHYLTSQETNNSTAYQHSPAVLLYLYKRTFVMLIIVYRIEKPFKNDCVILFSI